MNFSELTTSLNNIAEAVPHLVRIFSLGNSLGGHALWVAEVTNTNTGAASSKPAVWLDGNIHGGQFSATTSCLAVLQRLAAEHGRNPFITDLLDTKTFYIAPRLAPDGAELCLNSGLVTSAGRRLGFFDGLREGLVPGDINGDGRILQMRVSDPQGQWKVSKRDERLLVPREPGDCEGDFYRLYREGFLDEEFTNPLHLRLIDSKRELSCDFTQSCGPVNRHYGGSGIAGPFSQIESRLISSFLRSLDNLCLAVSFRSGLGAIQISCDSSVSNKDKTLLHLLASKAAEILNLPVQESEARNDFADWLYDELGIPCLRIDSWNLLREAGFDGQPEGADEAQMLAVLRWLDQNNAGKGIVPWTSCEHPQLGKVEVGGWDPSLSWFNPPTGEILEGICENQIDTVLRLASTLPKIRLGECSDEIVGWSEVEEGSEELLPLRIISVEIINDGYLPSWLTEKGRSKDEPLISEIVIPEDAELLLGRPRTERAPLSGVVSLHLRQNITAPFFSGCSENHRCVEKWLVRGAGEVVVSACQARCGVVQYITNGDESSIRQRFKVSKPSSIIPNSVKVVPAVSQPVVAVTNVSVAPPPPPPPPVVVTPVAPPPAPPTPAPAPVTEKTSTTHEVRPVNLISSFSKGAKSSIRGYKPKAPTHSVAQSATAVPPPQPPPPPPVPATPPPVIEEVVPMEEEKPAGSALIKASPLVRKEREASRKVQPSGRVFGQPPVKPGTINPASMRGGEPNPRGRSLVATTIDTERRYEVKPHPLLPSKKQAPPPPPKAPEPPPVEEAPEVPLKPSAPKLLRRSRGED
ncbi:hypothetical protein IJT10_01435 [bacterium]|nr:hypothetical protein [bacterium]